MHYYVRSDNNETGSLKTSLRTVLERRYKRKIEMYAISRETSYYYRGRNLAVVDCIIIIIVCTFIHILNKYNIHIICIINQAWGCRGEEGGRARHAYCGTQSRRTAAFLKRIVIVIVREPMENRAGGIIENWPTCCTLVSGVLDNKDFYKF